MFYLPLPLHLLEQLPLPADLSWICESPVNSDGRTKATRAQGIDSKDESGPKIALDQFFGPLITWIYHMRSPQIQQSEATASLTESTAVPEFFLSGN